MAVGCSHGHLANKAATREALKFKERWKPQVTIHLGDFFDLACFMREGHGRELDTADILADLAQGEEFLRALEPNWLFLGNHEDRLWRLAMSRNGTIAFAAMQGAQQIDDLAKDLKAQLVEYDIQAGWRTPCGSDTKFGHGYMFNENAARDHAEAFGKCVIAHIHTPCQQRGRRDDNPTGYCVGTLADIPAMRYAKTQRSRLRWGHGFAWGEFCQDETVVWVAEETQAGNWRLPV